MQSESNTTMEIKGKIILDLPEQGGVSKAGNNWKKKEWVLETYSQYPKKVKFTVFGEDRISRNQFEVGKDYSISVDVESREFNGRWYTDVNVYQSRPLSQEEVAAETGGAPMSNGAWNPAPQQHSGPQFGQASEMPFPQASGDPAVPFGDSSSDDLPF